MLLACWPKLPAGGATARQRQAQRQKGMKAAVPLPLHHAGAPAAAVPLPLRHAGGPAAAVPLLLRHAGAPAATLALCPPCPRLPCQWEELIERCQETGVDAFEINFSCPHGMPERKMGMAMGQVGPGCWLAAAGLCCVTLLARLCSCKLWRRGLAWLAVTFTLMAGRC